MERPPARLVTDDYRFLRGSYPTSTPRSIFFRHQCSCVKLIVICGTFRFSLYLSRAASASSERESIIGAGGYR